MRCHIIHGHGAVRLIKASEWGAGDDLRRMQREAATQLMHQLCKSQFPHKVVNLFFILVIVKDQLTDLWGS